MKASEKEFERECVDAVCHRCAIVVRRDDVEKRSLTGAREGYLQVVFIFPCWFVVVHSIKQDDVQTVVEQWFGLRSAISVACMDMRPLREHAPDFLFAVFFFGQR